MIKFPAMKSLLIVTLLSLPALANVQFQTFAFQGDLQNLTRVYLTPNVDPPLVTQLLPQYGCAYCLDFGLEFQGLKTSVWSMTIDVPGFTASASGDDTGECGTAHCITGYSWSVPVEYHPTHGTLTVTLDGTTAVYDFTYQIPVPEPSSLVLLLAGAGLLSSRIPTASTKSSSVRITEGM